ncbi:uncharacterized protein PFL1_05398 [Pseudozyma flocculosa PF-1]|nr:uncharacterized protein PFL1_05398 [Pseudozyma flocculosa PF-1]EPQ27116.1 hypothetical protein PFL1_05398 [Pseudozyma flocculosa PF-1]
MDKLDYSRPTNVSKPKVLLVNDDGPPGKNSPHVLGLYDEMLAAGWDVTVVLPSSQKSWGSMQFSLAGPVSFWYYYPIKGNADGSHPDTPKCWSATRRPINRERGEYAEWILVDGSPTTASNAGLFNQDAFFGDTPAEMAASPASNKTPFDLVVSGPNFGRNTGTAFALSSGTLGAAQAASLSGVRSIAVSYGHFMTNPPTLQDRGEAKGPGLGPEPLAAIRDVAHKLTVRILQRLWADWAGEKEVGCYSINVPLAETLRAPDVFWTRIWENRYGPLFASSSIGSAAQAKGGEGEGGSAPPPPAYLPASAPVPQHSIHFAPQMSSLLRPRSLEPGTDVWAVQNGYVSITRLRPNFMQVDSRGNGLDVASLEKRAAATGEESKASTGTDGDVKLPRPAPVEDGIEVGKRWRL